MTKPQKLPDVLTSDEQARLIAQPNAKCPTGLRNQVLIRLMLNLGLRADEALSITAHDIDWQTGRLHLKITKGSKDRLLWASEGDLSALRSWWALRASMAHPDGPLCCTLAGDKLDARYLREMIKRLAGKAGIGKDVHPHLLRHTFASDLYRKCANLRIVQTAMGHASIKTTEIYLTYSDDEVRDAMRGLRGEGDDKRGAG